jgi:hypothetical protein
MPVRCRVFEPEKNRGSPWLQAGFPWREWMVSALKIDATIEICDLS